MKSKMKSLNEVAYAHDMLQGLLHDDSLPEIVIARKKLHEDLIKSLNSSLRVLCWVLEHKEQDNFQELLDSIEQLMLAYGIKLKEEKDATIDKRQSTG